MCQLYIQCPDVYKCPDPDTDGESPDLLRFVLSCPEHILWQAAFLPSEVEVIYRHSRAIRTLLPTDNKAQDPVCVLCFKSGVGRKVTCCGTCGKAVHRDCLRVVIKVRKPKPPGSCWMCEDSSEWEIEKYREQNQEPAATTTATITSALPTQTANVIQQPFERKENDDHSVESSSSPKNQDHRDAQVDGNPEINQSPSHGTIVTEEDKMSEDELDGEGNAEGELEQEQDEDIEMGDTHPSPSLSSSSDFPSPSQSAVKQQELLTLPHAQHPSQASKDALPRLMNLTPLPTVPLQRSASVSLTSNLEPMSLELKHQKEQERVEKLPRGVSLDFSPALANSWTSVALGGHTSGQTPVLSAVGIDSQDSASATAAVTVQTATSASPGATPGVVDGPCPVNTTADVRQRKAAKLVRKCRRLEKEASYIGKRAKRRIKKIHKEYKRELKMLKEKRERLERKLKAID